MDPLGLDGGMHRMVYADSDPVQKQDPLGLVSCGGTPNLNIPPIHLVLDYEIMNSGAGPDMLFAAIDELKAQAGLAWAKSLADNLKIGNSSPIPFGPDPCGYTGCEPTGGDGFLGGFGGSSAVKNDKGSHDDLDSKSDIRHRERDARHADKSAAKYNFKYQKKYHREFPFHVDTAELSEGKELRDPDDPAGLNWDLVPDKNADAEQPAKTGPVEAPPVDPPAVTPPPPPPGGGGGFRIDFGGGGDTHDGSDYHPTAENLGHDVPPAGSSDYMGGAPRHVQPQILDEPPPPATTGEPDRATSPATHGPSPRPAPRLPAQRDDGPVSVPGWQDDVRTGGRGDRQSAWQQLMNRISLKQRQWAKHNWIPLFNLGPVGLVTFNMTTPFGTVQCTSMGCDFAPIWDRMPLNPDDANLSQNLGPAKITVHGTGAVEVEVSEGGASITCSSGTKTCQLKLAPTISIGKVDVTPELTSEGIFVTFSTEMALGEGWSVGASQKYELSPEFTPTQAGEYILNKIGLYPIYEALGD